MSDTADNRAGNRSQPSTSRRRTATRSASARRGATRPAEADDIAEPTEREAEPTAPAGEAHDEHPGADDRGDDTGDRLPATTDHGRDDERGASPILRYDQIPNELAEALRAVINRSELRAGAPLPKSIAVTSALLGAGVTTTSQSMATLIAQEMNSFACWVDCSWLSADAGAPDESRPSLIDILADQSRVHQAFQTTADLPNLLSFSPGPVPDSKRNMIVRSPEFDRLLGILADEFDHIIFDLPPVLSNANSLALLRRADASFLVVRHRGATLAQVERAIEAMQPTPNLGVLLNRYRTSIPLRLRRLLGE